MNFRILQIVCGLFLLFTIHTIQAQNIPANYYQLPKDLSGEALKTALNNIIQDHTEFTYTSTNTDTWDILKESDADPTNAANVIEVYSNRSVNGAQEYNNGAGWSREHVWPQSRGGFNTNRGIGTDLHNLKPVDISVNSVRGNRWFDYADHEYIDNGFATGSKTSSGREVWEPRDNVKGDIARIIFYMATRYEGENGEPDMEITDIFPGNASNEPLMALMSTLKTWHQQDPVDAFEINRNEVIYSYQGNRNPFIDHPEFVAKIWGPTITDGLFISEYIEGSSYNKAIEIFNNSPETVTLSQVKLQRDNGGNNIFSYSLNLEGTIAPFGVFVVAHSSACNPILKKTDLATASSVMGFNGDDQLRLVYNGSEIDHMGYFSNFGQDKTFVRAGHVTAPDPDVEDPQASWDWFELEEGNYSFLGYHETNETVSIPQLLISEYIEGSSYNKALELYNASTEPINLKQVALLKQTNGTGGYEGISLHGAIAPGMVYCIAYKDAHFELKKRADFITDNAVMTFNGNDPIQLVYKGVVIDQLGAAGGSNFAKDKTMYRDGRQTIPDPNWDSRQWYTLPQDDFSNVGYHYDATKTRLALSSTQNYIVAQSPQIPVSEIKTTHSTTNIATQVSYFDGLGRPLQEIALAQSPLQSDLVSGHEYDELGREAVQYLPYTKPRNGGAYRDFGFGDSGEQEIYYADNPAFDAYGNDRYHAFSETVFDNSPLNRAMKQGAPGLDWQPDNSTPDRLSSEHVISNTHETNANGEVYLFEVGTGNNLHKTGTYSAGTLYKTTTRDENGHTTAEYRDLQGKVIYKSALLSAAVFAKTYYVYDDFGLLRYVLPPEATAKVTNGTTPQANIQNQAWFAQWCYCYKYDARKRMVEKQLPGAAPIKMRYDNRDRLVLAQDGELRKTNTYLFTKYDALNRPTVTGKIRVTGEPAQIENYFDNYENSQATTYGTNGYHCEYPATLSISIGTMTVLTETYYDNYSFPGVYLFDPATCIANALEGNLYETEVKGMVTGIKIRVGDSDYDWTKETFYYNDDGSVIWSKKTVDIYPHTTTETMSTKYNFAQLPLQTQQTQSFNNQTTVVTTVNSYDHAGRLIQTDQQIEGQQWETLSQMKYNELGQLIEKKLGNGIQTVDFEYNIRGWLTQLNDPADAVNENTGNDLFAMELMYNKYQPSVNNPSDKQYNGNITAMQWTAKNNSQVMERQAYGFTYDGLDRLLGAGYAIGQWEPANGGFVNVLTVSNNYLVSGISYDLNGNITSLQRNDKGITGYLDNLKYNYTGNQLNYVTDAGDLDNGFKSNATAQASTKQYGYDANGNMQADNNKGITSITYNHLNLPTKIVLPGGSLNYLYGASGTKYQKRTSDNSDTRYYFSNFEYDKNMLLEYIHNNEGRVRVKSSFTYDYYLKDHLGNTRVVFTEENGAAKELQVSNYYPFGMRFNQSNTYDIAGKTSQYMYNGKELQEDFDLDWMDYGARFYDAALGRWHSVDPLCEVNRRWSPYRYAYNNPLRFIDPDGMLEDDPPWKSWNMEGTYSETDVNRTSNQIQVNSYSYSPSEGGNSTSSSIVGSSKNINNVSDKSAKVIANSMVEANESEVAVSSTTRTVEDQARIMYNNAEKDGAQSQIDLYAKPGEQVAKVYKDLREDTMEPCSAADTKWAMEMKIEEVGPTNVSNHIGDNSKVNVIDIGAKSVSNKKAFHTSVKANPGIQKSFTPYDKKAERAFHIEIKQ